MCSSDLYIILNNKIICGKDIKENINQNIQGKTQISKKEYIKYLKLYGLQRWICPDCMKKLKLMDEKQYNTLLSYCVNRVEL